MIIVKTDGIEIRFEDAIEAFVFDEKDKDKPTFHGAPMKAVDIVAEFVDSYVYIELKNYDHPESYNTDTATNINEIRQREEHFTWLKNYLKQKFRDSYLYRHAEQKVDKPIHYICLINFDNAVNRRIEKLLEYELPVGTVSQRWKKALAQSCQIVNLETWNKFFPKWPASRLPALST